MDLGNGIILVIEDDENDAFLLQHSLRRFGVKNLVHVLPTAEAFQEYIDGQNAYSDRDQYPLPSLIFLDGHLSVGRPGTYEEWLTRFLQSRSIPVVMLTGNCDPRKNQRAREDGAIGYFIKPLKAENVEEIAQALRERG